MRLLKKTGCISLPRGKSILHVVRIAIKKSNNHVYIWYEDRTVSSGTTTDFDYHFLPRPFVYAHGSGGTSYNIRGIAISKSDTVYAWFANGKVGSGHSTALNAYTNPQSYTTRVPLRNTGAQNDLNSGLTNL